MTVRPATATDRDAIQAIHRAAFPEGERDLVSALAARLLTEETQPPTLSLVAEKDGRVVGHIAFSPVKIGETETSAFLLAPLAVDPDEQKSGVGSKLVEFGIETLRNAKVSLLFVYGDPAYYGRFGFEDDLAAGFPPPHPLEFPFGWLARSLAEGSPPEPPRPITCVPALSDPALW